MVRTSACVARVQHQLEDRESANTGRDHKNVYGTLTFDPGLTSQTIMAPISADGSNEADETALRGLRVPTSSNLEYSQNRATIIDSV
jgi:hypothetical protein